MDADLLAEIDGARGRTSRSQFVREAIGEKLRGMGFHVSDDLVYPPDRASKVRPKKKTDQHVEMHGVNHGKISITQKKKSISTSTAPARKPARGKRGKKTES